MFDLTSAQVCTSEGGVFAMVIPPIALVLLAILVLWLFRAAIRELKQRADLGRIRDLVIEGSLGQAILISDQRSRDDVLAVTRAGLVTIQSSGSLEQAAEKIHQQAAFRFDGRRGLLRMAALSVLALAPAGIAAGGVVYAEGIVRNAAASLEEPAQREALLLQARTDPAFSCPVDLGLAAALLLAAPAFLTGILEMRRRSRATRERSVVAAIGFAEMASRVVDPSHRVYQQERARRRAE